jgi:hypothetical protein
MKQYRTLRIGAYCRAKCSAPARYIGFGKCLYVSAMTNELIVNEAREPDGNEYKLPLPSTWNVIKWGLKQI